MRLRPAHLFLFALAAGSIAPAQTVADLERQLGQLTVDPGQTYHVRDVRLRKGDVSIYLNEGVIAFASPVGGHVVAALFTTEGVDAGDAEILIMPPQPAERASLASFAKTPNLDEHFASAVFFFTDQTREEILSQIADPEHKRTPDVASSLAGAINPVLRANAQEVNTRLLRSLLSGPGASDEFFFSIVLGRDTGPFSFLYDPSDIEPVIVGATRHGPPAQFQLWTAYRPRRMPPDQPQPLRIAKYVIDGDIRPDLSLHASASFDWTASADDGRALRLFLSRKLKVESATLDGSPVEFVHPYSPDFEGRESDTDLLIAPATPVIAGPRISDYGSLQRARDSPGWRGVLFCG